MILLIVFLLILFIACFLLMIFLFDSIIFGHDLPTSKKITKKIIEIIKEKKANNFYDLGCAHGSLAINIKRKLPNLSVIAIDNNSRRIFFAKLKNLFLKNKVKFLKKNILKLDLSKADILYTYLWYDLMPILEKKLKKELKPGAIVITNTSKFPSWQPVKKIITYSKKSKTPDFETLFIYESFSSD